MADRPSETGSKSLDKWCPLVSVIIPTYNRSSLVRRAIKSVLEQKYQNFEILLVDDASSDDTEDVFSSFRDPRLRYIRHEVNKGAPAARNTGIKAARGKYLAFLDSDDEWMPQKLEVQLRKFRESELKPLGLVYSGCYREGNGRVVGTKPLYRGWLYETILGFEGIAATTSGIIVKRSCVGSSNFFDESLPALQEHDFLLRMARRWQFDVASCQLYVLHADSGNRITSPSNQLAARNALLAKYHLELSTRPGAKARHHFLAAVNCHGLGDMSQLRYHLVQAIQAKPGNLKWRLLLGGSFCGFRMFMWICAGYTFVSRIRNKSRFTGSIT